MARLHIINFKEERRVEVVLSRRNLLTLLHKLDMPGSFRQIENNDCYEDGQQTPYYPREELQSGLPRTTLVLRCEQDDEHYGKRPAGPGLMHPDTERFVAEHGGAPSDPNDSRPSGSEEMAMTVQDRHPNFRDRDGQLYLVRCFVCDPDRGVENHAGMAAAGQCAWCGWSAAKDTLNRAGEDGDE